MDLSKFHNDEFDRGRSRVVELLWLVLSGLLFSSWIPGSIWRVRMLRIFGSSIGSGVVIKQRVRVKFPWKLTVGSNVWLGEGVWIDNLDLVKIGNNVCISQNAYICTGSHDWSECDFALITKPVVIEDHAWICAKSVLGPGLRVCEGAVLGIASTATRDLEPWTIYGAAQVQVIRPRGMRKTIS